MRKMRMFGLLGLLIFLTSIFFYLKNLHQKKPPDVSFLVQELTVSPARQQNALDELIKYYSKHDKDLAQLEPYLEDKRSLATQDVRFLNTSPKSFEEYYMTEAHTVDELLIRYICWNTEKCDPGFPLSRLDNFRRDAQRALASSEKHKSALN
jgi:hypothetical protein